MSAPDIEKETSPAIIEPPSFSDGAGKEVWPTPVLRAGESEEEATIGGSYFRQLGPDDPKFRNWLTRLGTLLGGAKGPARRLSRLPSGYDLFTHVKPGREDTYLFGLPNGKKFRSSNEFGPHLQWLAKKGQTPDDTHCKCLHCDSQQAPRKRKHTGESDALGGDRTPSASRRKSGRGAGEDVKDTPASNQLDDAGVKTDSGSPTHKKQRRDEGAINDSGDRATSEDAKAKQFNKQVPTFWGGSIEYMDTQFDVLILRLQLGPNSAVISPRDTYWAPCPLFVAFPPHLNVTSVVKGRDIDRMMEMAKTYIIESLKRTTTLWAYQILVVPSFSPPDGNKETNVRRFSAVQTMLKENDSALFIRQDKVQFLLKPNGKYFTGYVMLQEAIMSWASGKEKPLLDLQPEI